MQAKKTAEEAPQKTRGNVLKNNPEPLFWGEKQT